MTIFRSNPIQLSEGIIIGPNEISDDIQILRVGKFFHEGQLIEVTKAHLKSMVVNFGKKVRGIDIMLDFSHESHKEAAAWFETLYLSEDKKELWSKVDWTEEGANAVRGKKYKYISADFNFAYKDNETLKDYGPTLLGAGLTNRPVIKNMEPTILSEDNEKPKNKDDDKENKMNFEEEFKKEKLKNEKLEKDLAELKEKMSGKKLAEREEAVKKKEDEIKLAEEKAAADKKLAEKKETFDKMLSEGKAVEAQREPYMTDDFAKFTENAAAPGDINLSEKGHGKQGDKGNHSESDTPAQDEVLELAEKKAKENKTDVSDEISVVLSENNELRKKYEKETSDK